MGQRRKPDLLRERCKCAEDWGWEGKSQKPYFPPSCFTNEPRPDFYVTSDKPEHYKYYIEIYFSFLKNLQKLWHIAVFSKF
jgi:hypothetical protein